MKSDRTWLAPALLMLAAVLIRAHALGSIAFEPDELGTLWDATRLSAASATGPGILGRPVYYVLQHVLLAVMAPTPLALRLPAFVFGIAGVWATWYAARRLFGEVAGIVAGALVVLSPWHQYASQFARYWTLVYLLAVLSYLFLVEATAEDRPASSVRAAVAMILGALTHPTFIFPMIGAVAAAHLVPPAAGAEGWAIRWPTGKAWRWLWIPLVVVVGGWFVGVKLTGNAGALGNFGGRGLSATAGAFFGMTEWATPAVIVAAGLGAIFLLERAAASDRRWGLLALLAVLSGGLLLLAGGLRNDVYADYGMALLPVVFVTIGGAVSRIAETAGAGRWPAVAAAAVLGAAQLPGLASNYRDVMRFDFRPAFAYVQKTDSTRLVVGTSTAIQKYYAPSLHFEEIGSDDGYLRRTLGRTGGFWMMMARHRSGWINGDELAQEWVDGNCRVVLRSGARRFDYREYDVDLVWCGTGNP